MPWYTYLIPRSFARCFTCGESRPEMIATFTPDVDQPLDAVPVLHVEHLEGFAARAVEKPAIRQDAVHIEHEQLDRGGDRRGRPAIARARGSDNARAKKIVDVQRADQFSARIGHRQGGDLVLLHQAHRLDGERAAGRCAWDVAVITSRIRNSRTLSAAADRAAQVAVGEHAEDAVGIVDDHRHPETFARHFFRPSRKGVFSCTRGTASPVRMNSSTCWSWRARLPLGWRRAKS